MSSTTRLSSTSAEQNHSSKAKQPTFLDAVSDLFSGVKYWRLWLLMAWNGLSVRYGRTWIGMGWLGLSFAIFVLVKIFIFGPMSGKNLAFYGVYLTLGFLTFQLISNFITGGAAVFIGAQSWIKSEPMPISVHLLKLAATNYIILAFTTIPTVLICLYFGSVHGLVLLSLPFAFLIFTISGLSASIIFGVICTRHRDLMQFMGTIMHLLYFATPILWVAPESGLRASIAHYNPITHYLALVREPALYGIIPWQSWYIVVAITFSLVIVAIFTFAKFRLKLIYWL